MLFDDNEKESAKDSSDEEFIPPAVEQEEKVDMDVCADR